MFSKAAKVGKSPAPSATVTAERKSDVGVRKFTCNFLWMCQGYYRMSQGYTPDWPGMSSYKGRIVHPQTWPEDLDYKGKKVIIIGSGATAATLLPAIADDCGHVTLLQRSPTYFIPGRNANELADLLRELKVDETWIHEIVRRKILFDQDAFTQRAFREPEVVKEDHDETLAWLDRVAAGKEAPDFPPAEPDEDNAGTARFGGGQQVKDHYF